MRNPLEKINLKMFQPLSNLKQLYLDETTNNIDFLKPPNTMDNLERLNLAFNQLPDGNAALQQLQSFPNLQFLSINVKTFVGGVKIDSIAEMFPNMKILVVVNSIFKKNKMSFIKLKLLKILVYSFTLETE